MKRVLLTGASSGIGLQIAEQLTSAGFEVWGTSRNLSRLPSFNNFHPIQMDLHSRDSIQNGWNQFIQEAGSIDVLINNAGSGFYASLENFPQEEIEKQFQSMVFAPIQLIQLAFPQLKENQGTILNITSLASQLPIPFCAPYNAAKAALSSLSSTLRLEQSQVKVIDLQPGDINTAFHDSMKKGSSSDYEPYFSQAYATIEKNMRSSPSADIVAKKVLQICQHPCSKVSYVGDFFQSVLAPLGKRLLPSAILEFILKKFYQ
jgi:short-subunit dehydrogenase